VKALFCLKPPQDTWEQTSCPTKKNPRKVPKPAQQTWCKVSEASTGLFARKNQGFSERLGEIIKTKTSRRVVKQQKDGLHKFSSQKASFPQPFDLFGNDIFSRMNIVQTIYTLSIGSSEKLKYCTKNLPQQLPCSLCICCHLESYKIS